VSPFEEFVRPFVEVARRHARTIEHALWVALVVLVLVMLAAGIAQSLG
jgi:hypothetical protein